MQIRITPLSDIPANEVERHEGFVQRSMVNLPDKDVTIRMITIAPNGIGPVPAHRHSDTHLFYILEGCLELTVEGVVHAVPKGSFVEVPPDAEHQLRSSGDPELAVLAMKWK